MTRQIEQLKEEIEKKDANLENETRLFPPFLVWLTV